MTLIKQTDFLKKYNIEKDKFTLTGLNWNTLSEIYEDYSSIKNNLENTAKLFYEILIKAENVNSVKFRLKDPEHLIEKIIRKKILKPEHDINIENYRHKVTDLIGIRALHIFKEDWIKIHKFIIEKWNQKNRPEAYIRKGDHEQYINLLKENDCIVKIHKYGYRSIHYTVKSNPTARLDIAEIQVRTIFEEGWSEVDHQIRYPYDLENPLLLQYLFIMNSIANSADQMGTYVKNLKGVEENYLKSLDAMKLQLKSTKVKNIKKSKLNKNINKFFQVPKESIYIPNQIQLILQNKTKGDK